MWEIKTQLLPITFRPVQILEPYKQKKIEIKIPSVREAEGLVNIASFNMCLVSAPGDLP